MQKLIRGIQKFQQETFKEMGKLFEELAVKQNPDVLFITCSDSRVDPTLLTDTDPGELFILRNAGNIVPPHGSPSVGEAATIEYAVVGLNVKHIIVCGHTQCGAMGGLLQSDALAEMPIVANWLRHADATKQIMKDHYQHLSGKELTMAAAEENVLVQLDHLRTIPAVATRLLTGDIKLHGWMYRFETAEVFEYDPGKKQFVPLDDDVWRKDHGSRGTQEVS